MNNDELISYPLPIFIILVCFVLIMIQIDVPLWTLYVAVFGVIVGIIYTIVYILILRESRIKRELPVIQEIIDNFVLRAREKLRWDINGSNSFKFPSSLNNSFGVEVKNSISKRFCKRKHILCLEILQYNRFCDKIN